MSRCRDDFLSLLIECYFHPAWEDHDATVPDDENRQQNDNNNNSRLYENLQGILSGGRETQIIIIGDLI